MEFYLWIVIVFFICVGISFFIAFEFDSEVFTYLSLVFLALSLIFTGVYSYSYNNLPCKFINESIKKDTIEYLNENLILDNYTSRMKHLFAQLNKHKLRDSLCDNSCELAYENIKTIKIKIPEIESLIEENQNNKELINSLK